MSSKQANEVFGVATFVTDSEYDGDVGTTTHVHIICRKVDELRDR